MFSALTPSSKSPSSYSTSYSTAAAAVSWSSSPPPECLLGRWTAVIFPENHDSCPPYWSEARYEARTGIPTSRTVEGEGTERGSSSSSSSLSPLTSSLLAPEVESFSLSSSLPQPSSSSDEFSSLSSLSLFSSSPTFLTTLPSLSTYTSPSSVNWAVSLSIPSLSLCESYPSSSSSGPRIPSFFFLSFSLSAFFLFLSASLALLDFLLFFLISAFPSWSSDTSLRLSSSSKSPAMRAILLSSRCLRRSASSLASSSGVLVRSVAFAFRWSIIYVLICTSHSSISLSLALSTPSLLFRAISRRSASLSRNWSREASSLKDSSMASNVSCCSSFALALSAFISFRRWIKSSSSDLRERYASPRSAAFPPPSEAEGPYGLDDAEERDLSNPPPPK
mmetsp:Transcript_62902/g.185786  ORF Transcript_62902/g.185786 Transcript_62902/m.185786 type:complete len:392 (+) Transcript_62902:1821-2996(+)